MKRVFALLLCFFICLSLLPTSVYAGDDDAGDDVYYDVSFEVDGVIVYTLPSVEKGTVLGTNAYPNPSKERSSFHCWLNNGVPFNTQSDKVDSDLILTADWGVPDTTRGTVAAGDEATCTEKGWTTYPCIYCGRSIRLQDINERGHDMVEFSAVDPTCTEDGNIAYYKCNTCQKCFSDREGENELTSVIRDATGHSFDQQKVSGKYQKSKATCLKPAEYYVSCSNKDCEASSKGTDDEQTFSYGDITSHDLLSHQAVDETCTVDGNIAYYECKVCKKKFADSDCTTELTAEDVVIPAKHPDEGHIWNEEGSCEDCTEKALKITVTITGAGSVKVNSAEVASGVTKMIDPSADIPITVKFIPETGMILKKVTVDGSPVETADGEYAISGNAGDHKQINVIFIAAPSKVPGEPKKEMVDETSPYYDAARERLQYIASEKGVNSTQIQYVVYDITPIWNDNSPMTPEELEEYGPITFTMPAPNDLSDEDYDFMVFHFQDGTFEKISDSLSVTTKDFSAFASFAIPHHVQAQQGSADAGNNSNEKGKLPKPVIDSESINNIIDDGIRDRDKGSFTIENGDGRTLEYLRSNSAPEYTDHGIIGTGPTITVNKVGNYYVRFIGAGGYTDSDWAGPIPISSFYTVTTILKTEKGGSVSSTNKEYGDGIYLVRSGGDIELTFTPAKHYWLSKVVVDDVAVTVTAESKIEISKIYSPTVVKYWFSASSSSPKTGDLNDVSLWIAEEIVSLLGMTTIVWYLFRRKETY